MAQNRTTRAVAWAMITAKAASTALGDSILCFIFHPQLLATTS
jgi:hypothetical protein